MQDPEFAAAYLADALEESEDEFLVALRKYVQATGGVRQCADRAKMHRESLYRMLSGRSNPRLSSGQRILQAQNMRLSIQPEKKSA